MKNLVEPNKNSTFALAIQKTAFQNIQKRHLRP